MANVLISKVREWLTCPACGAREIAWNGQDEWEGIECYCCGTHFEIKDGRPLPKTGNDSAVFPTKA